MLVVCFTVWLIIGIPVLYIEEIYLAIGQLPEVAEKAAKYMHILYPCMLFEMPFLCFSNFALGFKVVHYGVIVFFFSTLEHFIATYILYSRMDWGFEGICYATGSMFVTKGMIIIYLYKTSELFPRFDDVAMFSKETFSNFGPLLAMCLKSLIMSVW